MIWNDFAVIGDSISYGVRTNGNWIIEFCKLLWNEHNVIGRPFTFLKSGWTSGDFLKNIGTFFEKPKNELFLQLGTNDIRARVKPFEFATNMLLLSNMSLAKHIYIIEIPKPNGFGSNGYGNELNNVDKFNNAVEAVFEGFNLPVSFIKTEGLDFVDGIHLSNRGNIQLAKRVFKAVEDIRMWGV